MFNSCKRLLLGCGFLAASLHAAAPIKAHPPLAFEPNQGQADPRALFISRAHGYTLSLTRDGATLRLPGPPAPQSLSSTATLISGRHPRASGPAATLRLRWVGAEPGLQAVGEGRLPGHSSYFRGRDPHAWVTHVPHYGQVRVKGVYPGIDLLYYDRGGQALEFDWDVQPGADPAQIVLAMDGATGLGLDAHGDALADLGGGRRFRLGAPQAYQVLQGRRVPVAAGYRRQGALGLSLALGPWDRRQPLVIDPSLAYSTYFGGSGDDAAASIATDAAGDAYITGTTTSLDLITADPLQSAMEAGDAQDIYVSKFSPDGSTLLYSTYVSGADPTPAYYGGYFAVASAIAVDGAGNAYVGGATNSNSFPLVNPAQSSCPGCAGIVRGDAVVFELGPAGDALVFSTYLGGSGSLTSWRLSDQAFGIAVDAAGSATVVGRTFSLDFPVLNAIQPACDGCSGGGYLAEHCNAFVTKYAPGGASVVYSTYWGLSGNAAALCVALDPLGDAYVGGIGQVPLQAPLYSSGSGFVSEFAPDGSFVHYSTQILGADVRAIAVDSARAAYIAGSGNPNSVGSGLFIGAYNSVSATVAKLWPGGGGQAYSTVIAPPAGRGSGSVASGIALDAAGDAYICGWTSAPAFPLVEPVQAACDACTACPSCYTCPGCAFNDYTDGFVCELDPSGGSLLFSSYLGGSGIADAGNTLVNGDFAYGIAVDPAGEILVGGLTQSNDFPLVAPWQGSPGGGEDAFVAKISPLSPTPTPSDSVTPSPTPSLTDVQTATPTSSLTDSPSASASATASPTATPTDSATASPTASPVDSPTGSPTASPSPVATPTPSQVATPLASATTTPVPSASATPAVPVGELLHLLGVYPNPFHDQLRLAFKLGATAQVRLTCYNVAGEPLWSRVQPGLTAGLQQLVWDGDNDDGRRCASGVYLLRLEADGDGGATQAVWVRAAIIR